MESKKVAERPFRRAPLLCHILLLQGWVRVFIAASCSLESADFFIGAFLTIISTT